MVLSLVMVSLLLRAVPAVISGGAEAAAADALLSATRIEPIRAEAPLLLARIEPIEADALLSAARIEPITADVSAFGHRIRAIRAEPLLFVARTEWIRQTLCSRSLESSGTEQLNDDEPRAWPPRFHNYAARFLRHLGEATEPPPRAPARIRLFWQSRKRAADSTNGPGRWRCSRSTSTEGRQQGEECAPVAPGPRPEGRGSTSRCATSTTAFSLQRPSSHSDSRTSAWSRHPEADASAYFRDLDVRETELTRLVADVERELSRLVEVSGRTPGKRLIHRTAEVSGFPDDGTACRDKSACFASARSVLMGTHGANHEQDLFPGCAWALDVCDRLQRSYRRGRKRRKQAAVASAATVSAAPSSPRTDAPSGRS